MLARWPCGKYWKQIYKWANFVLTYYVLLVNQQIWLWKGHNSWKINNGSYPLTVKVWPILLFLLFSFEYVEPRVLFRNQDPGRVSMNWKASAPYLKNVTVETWSQYRESLGTLRPGYRKFEHFYLQK